MNSEYIEKLKKHLNLWEPNPEMVKNIIKSGDEDILSNYIQLWVKENIPYFFKDTPWLYSFIRYFLSKHLDINESDTTIIGSAKTGFSIQNKTLAISNFNSNSDLDFTIISNCLFERLKQDAILFLTEYKNNDIMAKTNYEKSVWESTLTNLPRNLNKGFIDPHKIPNFKRYQTISKFNITISKLKIILLKADNRPNYNKISFRIYRSWSSFKNQNIINLKNKKSL